MPCVMMTRPVETNIISVRSVSRLETPSNNVALLYGQFIREQARELCFATNQICATRWHELLCDSQADSYGSRNRKEFSFTVSKPTQPMGDITWYLVPGMPQQQHAALSTRNTLTPTTYTTR